jgi:hypothetical protein
MNEPVRHTQATSAERSLMTYPSVSEGLASLSKIYQTKWRQYYLDRPLVSSRSREKHALIAGVLMVEAQLSLAMMEKAQWLPISEDLKNQITTLGVMTLEGTRWARLGELIEAGSWSVAAREFDTWGLELEHLFTERRDQRLARLVRLAAWLRLLHIEALCASRPVITDPPTFLPCVDLWAYLEDLSTEAQEPDKAEKPPIMLETAQLLSQMKEWAQLCRADFRSVTEPTDWLKQYFEKLFT